MARRRTPHSRPVHRAVPPSPMRRLLGPGYQFPTVNDHVLQLCGRS